MPASQPRCLALLFTVLLLLSGCGLASTQKRDHFFDVTGTPCVQADVGVSRLTVRPGTESRVHVVSTLRHARQTDYQVVRSGDSVSIHVSIQPGVPSRLDTPPVEVILTVPANADLDLRSTTGYVYVDEVSGQITVKTLTGGMQLSDCQGRIELNSQSASIACRRTSGTLHIVSDAGSVSLEDATGTFAVQTGSGAISLSAVFTSGEQHRIESSSGSIQVRILGTPDLQVDAVSQTGSVRCLLEMTDQISTKRECKGTIGAGTGQLLIRTATGNVTVQ